MASIEVFIYIYYIFGDLLERLLLKYFNGGNAKNQTGGNGKTAVGTLTAIKG